jgi:hypothetical protein
MVGESTVVQVLCLRDCENCGHVQGWLRGQLFLQPCTARLPRFLFAASSSNLFTPCCCCQATLNATVPYIQKWFRPKDSISPPKLASECDPFYNFSSCDSFIPFKKIRPYRLTPWLWLYSSLATAIVRHLHDLKVIVDLNIWGALSLQNNLRFFTADFHHYALYPTHTSLGRGLQRPHYHTDLVESRLIVTTLSSLLSLRINSTTYSFKLLPTSTHYEVSLHSPCHHWPHRRSRLRRLASSSRR